MRTNFLFSAILLALALRLPAQGVVAPYVEPLDYLAGLPATPSPGNGIAPVGTAWDFEASDAQARLRIGRPGVDFPLPGYVPVPVFQNSGDCFVLDRTVAGADSTNTLVFHVDYAASDLGLGIRVRFWLRESGDETHATDVIAIQDGMTLGDGVLATGASTGAPGFGGYRESLLFDWNALQTGTSWTEVEVLIDDAFLGTVFGPSSTSTNDLRIVFRQTDNGSLPTDGLLIDHVRVHPVATGSGQAPQNGLASFDLNGAEDVSGAYVASLRPGPYRARIPNGLADVVLTVTGIPNRPIVLAIGPLAIGALNVPGVGAVDIGIPSPGLPTGITVLADGTGPGFFDSFFVTPPSGTMTLALGPATFALTGTIGTLQCAVYTGGPSVIALSNAITLEVY